MNLATVKRGDTWQFVFNWRSGDTPIDLSNCTARMQIRKRKLGTLLAEVSTDGSITIDAPLGKVIVIFPAELSAGCEVGTHETDLEVTFDNGYVKSTDTMYLIVKQDITR